MSGVYTATDPVYMNQRECWDGEECTSVWIICLRCLRTTQTSDWWDIDVSMNIAYYKESHGLSFHWTSANFIFLNGLWKWSGNNLSIRWWRNYFKRDLWVSSFNRKQISNLSEINLSLLCMCVRPLNRHYEKKKKKTHKH